MISGKLIGWMTMLCKQKIVFHTTAIAEAARREYCAQHKTDKRGQHCGKFHLGHLRRKSKPQPAPEPKQPTAGDLRRAEKRADARKAERAVRYGDWAETLRHVARLIDRDFANRA
jgi:hypothetical protein